MYDPRAGGMLGIRNRESRDAGIRDPGRQQHCDDACVGSMLVTVIHYTYVPWNSDYPKQCGAVLLHQMATEVRNSNSQNDLATLSGVVGYQRHCHSAKGSISLSW